MPIDADYTIADLARLTGLSVRTIRYWIAQGLLPASGESGPGAHYGQGHLDRLRVIKRLQAEYLPNAEIRRRLAPLSDAAVASLVSEASAADSARPTTSALDYIRDVLSGSGPLPAREPADSMPIRAYPAAELDLAPPVAPSPTAQAAPNAPAAPIEPATAIRPRLLRLGYSRMRIESDAGEQGGGEPTMLATTSPTEAATPTGAETPTEAPGSAAPAATIESPQPERSQWERLLLTDNIELHIRRPLSRPEQRRVERLITIARQVLNEGGEA